MHDTAEAHSHTIPTNRNCTIEITNVSSTYYLHNPQVSMESGFPHSPPQPTIRYDKTEVCSFTKDDHTASGAVGVLTYELFHMKYRSSKQLVAIMFSVPFDYNFYKNWLGVGIFDIKTNTDKELFNLMYNKSPVGFMRHEADGSGVKWTSDDLDIRGTMSDEGKAIIKLEVYDKMC